MTAIEKKKIAFSYMIDFFKEWYLDTSPKSSDKDFFSKFSKLSLLKLLFLTSAIKTEEDKDLLDVFSNFCALPYGPVESDVYNAIIANEIPNYTIGDNSIWKNEVSIFEDNIELKNKIESSVVALKNKNKNLINLDAFELVEITHKWQSWLEAYEFAEFIGQRGMVMNIDDIRKDGNQFFGVK